MNILDCPKRIWVIYVGDADVGIIATGAPLHSAPSRETVARFGPHARAAEYLRVDDVEMED